MTERQIRIGAFITMVMVGMSAVLLYNILHLTGFLIFICITAFVVWYHRKEDT